jgi:hypothetical protein
MSAYQTSNPVEAQLMLVAELFGSVCADPDNPEVTAAADKALRDLDDLLASSGS